MPNWCENRVTVSGKSEEVKRLVEFVGKEFDFQKVLPMPEELEDTTSPIRTKGENVNMTPERQKELLDKYGFDNWYDWRISNWGTKWNLQPQDVEVLVEDDFCEFKFLTAWSPPVGICEKLRELFPDLTISWFYDEPSMESAGYL